MTTNYALTALRRAGLILIAAGFGFAPVHPSPPAAQVGIARLQAVDAVHHDTMGVTMWYPSSDAARDTSIALTPLHVAVNGRLLGTAPRPLIVISHGTGGNDMGHWDTAESLVRAGFIVASVRHAGDNSADHSALGTDRYLYGRSSQIHAVLDTLLHDPEWRSRISANRIGFLGFSVGGLTGLELVGGVPRPTRFTAFCARHPSLPEFCGSGLNGHFDLTGAYPAPTADPRIRSAVLWAPAYSFMFDSAGLARVHVPLMIERGSADPIVLEPDDVLHIVPLLRENRVPVTVHVMPGAHFTFLAPCGVALARAVPSICQDPPDVNRVAVHVRLNSDAVAFFQRTLGARR